MTKVAKKTKAPEAQAQAPSGLFRVLIKKTGQIVDVDFNQLPEASQHYLIMYGLKQRLNDCHSDITETAYPDQKARFDLVTSAVEEVLGALKEGKVSMRKAGAGLGVKLGKKLLSRALAVLLSEVNSQSEATNLGIIDAKGYENILEVAKRKYDIQLGDVTTKAMELANEVKAQQGDMDNLI